uniref:Putative secreted protein n=1 Tax=Anopheles darlingi TaxID=43151 RepID=A0A2M4DDP4_ANODA
MALCVFALQLLNMSALVGRLVCRGRWLVGLMLLSEGGGAGESESNDQHMIMIFTCSLACLVVPFVDGPPMCRQA